ncbi:MFS general substrate transporter [Karstenula rhodostoma CBS 690.94]|uniref:MFS general substrate transporter n=1 Tax=Karstenula rhodostoma CBS 690.94 TaxID=1392251 RepID=A0A9P4PVS2_9PLEO|nr:MFS general substrate transporter [Karstenula rhodostoma CBS 690.94]
MPSSSRSAHAPSTSASSHAPERSSNAYELRPISPKEEHNTDNDIDIEEDDDDDDDDDEPSLSHAPPPTPTESAHVRRKLDTHLVAFLALLYSLSFLDRSNIGNARIAGLALDLRLTDTQYEWLLWAFYLTYIAFEWMTLLYRVVPAHAYIAACIAAWGVFASLQAVATSFGALVVLRALLGVSEAAFGPGVPFYLSFFFRREELALRTGLFISASPLSASFAGGLAWAITKVGEGGMVRPWRLLFLVEGFPSVLVAVWAWDFVPDGPGTAGWLSAREREVAVLRLRDEDDGMEGKHAHATPRTTGLDMHAVLVTLKDPKCYLTAFMFFSANVAFASLPVFLPTILHEMGHTALTAQALTAPPYLFAFVVVLLTAYLSDRHHSRAWYIILHALLAAAGYATLALCGLFTANLPTLRYLSLFPATAGFFAAITIIITWTLNNQSSSSAKGTGVAIMNVIGQTGPLLGTSIFPSTDGPFYTRGMTICASFMLLVALLAWTLRWHLMRENERRRRMGAGYASLGRRGRGGERTPPFEYIL